MYDKEQLKMDIKTKLWVLPLLFGAILLLLSTDCAWFEATMARDSEGKREQIFGIDRCEKFHPKNDATEYWIKDTLGYWKRIE